MSPYVQTINLLSQSFTFGLTSVNRCEQGLPSLMIEYVSYEIYVKELDNDADDAFS